MQRKFTFHTGEYYHIFNRGVDKRKIFLDKRDWDRFQQLLYIANAKNPVDFRSNRQTPFGMQRSSTLVDILAYAQMPNHYHLILHEKIPGGISKFISKAATAYSMYFNAKYRRSGPVFCKPFRARHIDTDDYFRWVFSYVNLNPIPLFEAEDERHDDPKIGTAGFMASYKYASFTDYLCAERPESKILSKEKLLFDINDIPTMDEMFAMLVRMPDYARKVQRKREFPGEKDWN
jgi:putative transposase